MLKIRLSRTGKRTQASYRVVVQEHTAPVKGKFVEVLGNYVPTRDPKEFTINSERVKYWLSVGAQPSDTMATLLKREGFEGMDKFIEPRNRKRKKKKEVEEPEAAPAETAETPVEAPAEEAAAPAEEPKAEEAPAPEAAEAPTEEKAEEPAPEVAPEAPAEEAKAEEAPAETAEAPAEDSN